MHMNSAPHLLPEDRPDFERALDDALRTADRRAGLGELGQRISAERLRTMALGAATAIAACAAVEYDQFVRLREELRQSVQGSPAPHESAADSASGPADSSYRAEPERGGAGDESAGAGFSGTVGEGLAESAGAGLTAMLSVLLPVLAGTAAVIFLVLGYGLLLLSPEPAVGATIRTVGWTFTALAAAGALLSMAGVWGSALRNRRRSSRTSPSVLQPPPSAGRRRSGSSVGPAGGVREEPLSQRVAEAREAWREALLERGIVPFLREALADPQGQARTPASCVPRRTEAEASAGGAGESGSETEDEEQRTPQLGYSHPGFSSDTSTPADGPGGQRNGDGTRSDGPSFSSPDFSSPDYGTGGGG